MKTSFVQTPMSQSRWMLCRSVEYVLTQHSVVVSSGMIALVDDCIKRRFHTKQARQILIPVPKFRMDMEYIGPKKLINEVFSRPSTRGSTTARRPTPLRQTSHDV